MPALQHKSPIRVIDTHTAGEATRVVVSGSPDLGGGGMASRLARMRHTADWLRTSLCNEPRGNEAMVGALLLEPESEHATAGVVFFNNIGYLGMCGHGTIGVVETLAFLGRIQPGPHRIETPVGDVTVTLHEDRTVAVENVLSYRWRTGVTVDAGRFGSFTGEVAYGGNWFFFAHTDRELRLQDAAELTRIGSAIGQALVDQGVAGENGAPVDHIELLGPPTDPALADAKNFVLCPGAQYDRSPCGTGTSAKLACLAAEGKLAEGEVWRQESIAGGVFEGSYRRVAGGVIPTIVGRAHVNGDLQLLFDQDDPFKYGIFPPDATPPRTHE